MALAQAIKMMQAQAPKVASNTLRKQIPLNASSTMNPNLGGRPPITFNPYSTDSRPPQGMQPMMPMQGQPRPSPALAPNPGRPGLVNQNPPMVKPNTQPIMPLQGQPRPMPAFAPNPGRPANMDMPQGLNTLVKPQPMTDFGGGMSSGMLQDLAGRYGLDANALFGNFQMPQVQNQQMPFQQMQSNGLGNQFPMTRFPDSNPYQMNSMQPMQNYQQQSMFPQSGYQLQQPQQQPQQSMYPQYGNFGNQFANQSQSQSQNFGGLDSAIQNMNQNKFWF